MNNCVVKNELVKTIQEIESGKIWLDFDNETPHYVSKKLAYPHDKAAEIDMYIAKSFGEITQVDALTYNIIMPTCEKEKIALLAFTYGQTLRTPYSKTPRESLHQFLVEYNLFHKLRQLCDDFMFLECGQNHPLRDKARDVANTYIKSIRKKRTVIHSEMIANGVAGNRWKNEQIAFTIIKEIYPDAIYQYKSSWLGQQSLDIYIPSIKVGIEYQGVQHFLPVDIFGAEKGLDETKSRDKKKKEKCYANGVHLIEWTYDEPLTGDFIKGKIDFILIEESI